MNKETDIVKSNLSVSVIIPTYNKAHLLGRAVQSVLNQTYQDFEVIVVDDCSSDNTERVVIGFDDDRIRYIRHEENKGAAAARNTGIKAAEGEYIAFLDSDDEWLSEKLEKQVRAFADGSTDLGVVYTGVRFIAGNKIKYAPSSNIKKKEGYIHAVLLETNFIPLPAAIVKKECLEKVGMFDESLPRLQEWDLWIRISTHYHFKYISELLVNAYQQPDGISRDVNALIVASEYILQKYFKEISRNPKLLGQHYFGIGTILSIKGEIKRGRNYFFKAVKTYPFNAKLILSTLTSFLGLRAYSSACKIYSKLKDT